MTKPIRRLIIAPHFDDEVIGCWSVLRTHIASLEDDTLDVLFCCETDNKERLKEAQEVSLYFGFNIYLKHPDKNPTPEFFARYSEVYVPSRKDSHAAHRELASQYAEIATHFYSVDMVNATPLPQGQAQAKREFLDKFYSSQKKLWERDDRYWLFESIHQEDFTTYCTIRGTIQPSLLPLGNEPEFSIAKESSEWAFEFPKQYKTAVLANINAVATFISQQQAGKALAVMSRLCPTGHITLSNADTKYTTKD